MNIKYLSLLSKLYRNINEASGEIINLQAICYMPKGTEHFVSDVHGEFDAFTHVLKNGSGVIRNYIDELFGNALMETEKKHLATLIYYPEEKLALVRESEENLNDWHRIYLFRLLEICKRVSSKYTRSKVRKALPKEFSYILEELIHEDNSRLHKHDYYNEIVDTIIRLGRAEHFIIDICFLIHRLAVDHLHVLGDIYDRGSSADKIMDYLYDYHSVDFQWGNHDIAWMGAASGSEALICNVIRISARYNNLDTIEEGYGINLVPLASFALEAYGNDPCGRFIPENSQGIAQREISLAAKIHKAITIIQFKLEAGLILSHPEYEMNSRILLDKIDFAAKTVTIGSETFPLSDSNFPTLDPENPLALTAEERAVVDKIRVSFMNSQRLQEHTKLLYNKGSIYLKYNQNLLFHGCIPFDEGGEYKETICCGKKTGGRDLLDAFEVLARQGRFSPQGSDEKKAGLDALWYLWCGPASPLFGRKKMATFEAYFTNQKKLRVEGDDPYYSLRDREDICRKILADFGLDPNSGRIVNGHVPVKVLMGESPVKADGKLIVIDGGFSKPYHAVTGIAGYTLISNSQGLLLAAHDPFVTGEEAVSREIDIVSSTQYIERYPLRKKVSDTDIGDSIREQIQDLEELLRAYKDGHIKEISV